MTLSPTYLELKGSGTIINGVYTYVLYPSLWLKKLCASQIQRCSWINLQLTRLPKLRITVSYCWLLHACNNYTATTHTFTESSSPTRRRAIAIWLPLSTES